MNLVSFGGNVGGDGDEVLVDVLETTDGDFMLAGFSNSEGFQEKSPIQITELMITASLGSLKNITLLTVLYLPI